MAMFGKAAADFASPSNWADRLAIIGAGLKDASPGSSGDALQGIMGLQAARQQKSQQDAVFAQIAGMLGPQTSPGQITGPAPSVGVARRPGLFGGQAAANMNDPSAALPVAEPTPDAGGPMDPGQPFAYQAGKTTPGLSIDDPRMAPLTLMAQKAGVPIKDLLEVLKAQQPHMMSAQDGTLVNDKSGKFEGMQFPKLDNGIISQRGSNGELLGASALPGYAGAAASIAGATTAAQEREKAALDLVDVPQSDGSTVKMPRSRAVALLGGGVAPPTRGTAFGPRPGVGVTQSPADAAYTSDLAKSAATTYQGLQDAARKAPTQIAKYQQLGTLLDGFEGGKFAPALKDFSSAANSLGFKVDKNLPNKDAAAAITNELALSLRDPSNGGGMPGAMSDADRNFLIQSVPGLVQTAQGRRQMVDAQVKVLQRQTDVAAKARQWQQRFGRIDKADATGKTFQDYLDTYAAAHPLFAPAK